jgi:hypothetical protein
MNENKEGRRHNTHKVNYNYTCDLERFDKMTAFLTSFADCKRMPKYLQLFLEQVKTFISCSLGSVFVFQSGIFNYKDLSKDLTAQKSSLDGKFIDIIGLTRHPL